MKILVTGSSGHLGEALIVRLQQTNHDVIGLDTTASMFTRHQASVADPVAVAEAIRGVDAVVHTGAIRGRADSASARTRRMDHRGCRG